jgi:hypothetical protein
MHRKPYIYIIVLLFIKCALFAQTGNAPNGFNHSLGCETNVNTSDIWASGRRGVINATFKYVYQSGVHMIGCTGTLVNRKTGDDNVGFYFITARHCITDCDFNGDIEFFFNYQSPDASSSSTATTNKGESDVGIPANTSTTFEITNCN